jgi:hypothetical protein
MTKPKREVPLKARRVSPEEWAKLGLPLESTVISMFHDMPCDLSYDEIIAEEPEEDSPPAALAGVDAERLTRLLGGMPCDNQDDPEEVALNEKLAMEADPQLMGWVATERRKRQQRPS